MLRNTIEENMKNAMMTKARMAKDTEATKEQKSEVNNRLSTLRSISAAITAEETSGKTRKELGEQEVQALLKRLVKKRKETAEEYRTVGAIERAEAEESEAAIIAEFLPEEMSKEKLTELILEIIENKGLKDAGPRGIGQVMGQLKNRPEIDAAMASKIAKENL